MKAYLDPNTQAFMRYFDFPGDEPTLVFLAGLGLASTAIYPRVVVEPCLLGRHSILVDLFGCGYSDRPEQYNYSLEEHAITLSGFLDHIGAMQYVLVGHSLGGAIAIELAALRPDLIGQIIMAEANVDAGGGPLSRAIAHQTESNFIQTGYQKLMEERRSAAIAGNQAASIFVGLWQAASPLAIHRSAISVVEGTRPLIWDKLIRMPIPKTYLFGSRSLEDYEGDREIYARLEKHGIRVDVVPDAGHGMMVDNPVGFANAICNAMKLVGL